MFFRRRSLLRIFTAKKNCVYVLRCVPNADVSSFAPNSSLPDLPPPTVTEECYAIQMSGSSRSTRRRVLVAQTNATTDPTSQCLDPHTHDTTDPASQCSNRHKRETLLSEYFSFANLVMLHVRIPYFFVRRHGHIWLQAILHKSNTSLPRLILYTCCSSPAHK